MNEIGTSVDFAYCKRRSFVFVCLVEGNYIHALRLNAYRSTSNLTDIPNYSDSIMNYFLTSNLIVHVYSLEYFLL